jgi:methylthioribose-1-phosphate isomerase
MKVKGEHIKTIWVNEKNSRIIEIIDQRKLPHSFEVVSLESVDDAAMAIKEMYVRGAGLIGVTAAYGMYLGALALSVKSAEDFSQGIHQAGEKLVKTRPTAKNLEWAVKRQLQVMEKEKNVKKKVERAFETAGIIAEEDIQFSRSIGRHGLTIIKGIKREKSGEAVVQILTHCNAGWLAFVDYGSATAPIYTAYDEGIPLHVWVDETRPRNQGANLTAWELSQHGVSFDVVVDNAGGHLMQHGMVDMVIVGADRVTREGDAANKIGTYLKALAARDNGIPFYVALPSSTFDWEISDGVKDIPIEERNPREVTHIFGFNEERRQTEEIRLTPEGAGARNFGFDVTPARLITGLITERGVCSAEEGSILELFPEYA